MRALSAADDPITAIHDGDAWNGIRGEREAMDLILDLDATYLRTASGAMILVAPFEDPADQVVDYPVRLSDVVEPVLGRFAA